MKTNERLPTKVSESVRRLNPHLYPIVGGLAASQPEPVAILPLVKGVKKRKSGKEGVEIVVSFVSFRRRELDDDGNVAALKPLRDAVATTIGIDDGDKRIRFEYSQLETRGPEGVIVKVYKI